MSTALAFDCDWLEEEGYGVHLFEFQGHLECIEREGTLVPAVESAHALSSSCIVVHQHLKPVAGCVKEESS